MSGYFPSVPGANTVCICHITLFNKMIQVKYDIVNYKVTILHATLHLIHKAFTIFEIRCNICDKCDDDMTIRHCSIFIINYKI